LQGEKPAITGSSFNKTFIGLNVFLGFYVFLRIQARNLKEEQKMFFKHQNDTKSLNLTND